MLSVAVITPSLNQGTFIERTLRSVLEQSYACLEYVVCDGGSTDNTLTVLAAYSQRLRLVSEPDAGQADAVNKGIRMTSGDVVGWLNSDDVYYPGALATVTAYLEQHPTIDVVYGDAVLLDADDVVLGDYYTEPWRPARLPERCFLCQPAVFFRRALVERFGLLDASLHYCLDYEYWLRLAAGGARFGYVHQVLAGSRLHPTAKTLADRPAIHRELNTMLRARLGQVPASWLVNHAYTLIELRTASRQPPPIPFGLAVVLTSVWLSLKWNGRLSPGLVQWSARTLLSGAARRLRQKSTEY